MEAIVGIEEPLIGLQCSDSGAHRAGFYHLIADRQDDCACSSA